MLSCSKNTRNKKKPCNQIDRQAKLGCFQMTHFEYFVLGVAIGISLSIAWICRDDGYRWW